MVQRVQSALATLDEDKRAVFVLFELEGESCESIAKGLEIPVGTVYSRLHSARKDFTKAHARITGEPVPASTKPKKKRSGRGTPPPGEAGPPTSGNDDDVVMGAGV